MGKTLRYLTEECGVSNYDLDKLTPQKVKSSVRYAPSIGTEWKVKLAKELQAVRNNQMEVEGFTKEELEELFGFICIN